MLYSLVVDDGIGNCLYYRRQVKVKVKFSLSTLQRSIREVDFKLHSFVTSALDGSELQRHIKIMDPSHMRTVIGANLFSGKITFLAAISKVSVLLLSWYFIFFSQIKSVSI